MNLLNSKLLKWLKNLVLARPITSVLVLFHLHTLEWCEKPNFFKGWTLSLSLWYCLDIFFHLIRLEKYFLTTLRYPYQMFSCLLCTVFEAIANWLLSKRIKVNNVADLTIQTRFYLTFQAKPELFPLPIDQC